jgi:SM-20-related protein
MEHPSPFERAMPPWSARVADALAGNRVAVIEGAFAADTIASLRAEASRRDAEGDLRAAGIGRGSAKAVAQAVRGDRIAWLDEASTHPAERDYLAQMHALAQALNRDLMLGIASLEAHYAIYPPGASYARHRDRFRDDDARVLSCILYLNAAWRSADGGALRLYLGATSRVDIEPQGGTLVVFAAERFEHEVLPATRVRLAITGWFRRREI